MDAEQAASERARRQHGLITRAQARQLGISDDAIDWRVKTGSWERVQRGVLRLPGAPVTWQQAVIAPCLAVPGATASHRAAAALWQLPEIASRPEITILDRRRLKLPGVEVHHTDRLDHRDRVWREHIPVTSLDRTVIDLSSVLRPEQMEAVVAHVLAKRRVCLSALPSRLDARGTQGRHGAGVLAEMLVEWQGRKRHVDSAAQRRLEQLVTLAARQGRLPTPFFEYPVQFRDGRWRYPDVGYPDHTTGVELVSYEHHATLTAFAKDIDRNLEMVEGDWFLIPVTDRHVKNEPDRVVDVIATVIARREVRNAIRGTRG